MAIIDVTLLLNGVALVAESIPAAFELASDSAVGLVVATFLRQRDVLWLLAVLAAASLLVAGPLARRLRAPFVLALLMLWSLAGIVALTAVPDGGFADLLRTPASFSRVRLQFSSGWSGAFTSWRHGTNGPLNVLLFVPAGLFSSLVLRRSLGVVLGLACLSVLIELLQAYTGTRAGNPGDVGANILGAALGVLAAVALRRARPRRDHARVYQAWSSPGGKR